MSPMVDAVFSKDTVSILHAARDTLVAQGVRSTSADDIAKAAGISRVTLYRRIGKKQQVIDAAFLMEITEIADRIYAAVLPYDSLEWEPLQHLENWIFHSIWEFRHSEFVQLLISTEEGLEVSEILGGSTEDLKIITDVLADMLRRTWKADVHSKPLTEQELEDYSRAHGAMLGRLLHSMVLRPTGEPEIHTEAEIRTFARTYIAPLFLMRR